MNRAAASTQPLGCQEEFRMQLIGLAFRAFANSKNGSLNTETIMRFTSEDGVIVGSYNGGTIVVGQTTSLTAI